MFFQIKQPPACTGEYKKDIKSLFNWCADLHRRLRAMFNSVENSQIASIDASKIRSNILTINDNYFRLGNSTDYIEFKNGILKISSSTSVSPSAMDDVQE